MANSITFISFLIFCCFASLTPNTLSSTNQTDLLSLLGLRSSIDIDPRGSLNSWNQTTHFCSWEGISCGGRRHPDRVVGINLSSLGLVGLLSPHIGNLSFLRTITLQNNTFHGPIPQEISLLRRLEYLEFSNNSFSGSIPRNISRCTNLVYLNLIDNNLSGVIPPEFGFLHKLEDLGLKKNEFSGTIPQSIGNLTSLRRLFLASCGLEGEIPESLAQLQGLTAFVLDDNKLFGSIPPGLFNISTLIAFGVGANGFEGSIPSTIGLTLPNLRYLVLLHNRFSGRIPVSLSNVSSLQQLSLEGNSFIGTLPSFRRLSRLQFLEVADNSIEDDISFFSSLTNCTNLAFLSVGQNLLRGQIPNTIANLSIYLQVLAMAATQVHGTIPSGIGNLIGLTTLYLPDNNLQGPVPVDIGKLANLNELYLYGNRLTNELPSSLGNLSSLTMLDLHRNNFTGVIPTSLVNLTKLLSLELSLNNLNGHIPREIMELSSISISFNLSFNAFNGSIPFEVRFLTNLAKLDMSNNMLTGLIPNNLSSCTSLQILYLDGNLLEGEIPQGLRSITGLQDLGLSRNNLSGSIPSFLGALRLEYLNLSFNRLQGEVPTRGVFGNISAISLQGNEKLCGGMLELNLPSCTSSKPTKKTLSTLLEVLIPTVTIAAFLCLAIFIYKRKTPKINSSSPASFLETQFLRLSYADLLEATNGFSESHLLGAGSFGSVYKGILDDGGTLIAVKVLNLVVRGASKSFIAECNALRGIRHRNLVKILSVCESIDFQGNDFKALIYEFKASGSLEKWLHRNNEKEEQSDAQVTKLNMIQRLNIAIDIAHALEYLHFGTDSTIVHGDLKPSNILLDNDMTACVGDFGLAKIISSRWNKALRAVQLG